jgi:hypothetical protein
MALGIQALIQRPLVALLLVAAGLLACNHAQAQQPLRAPTATLADTLRKAAGEQPVFFLLAGGAVEARSANESMKRSIVAAPVQEALYDAALELLWVHREGRLEVVDLRKANPTPVPIVANMGDEGEFVIQTKDKRTLRIPDACVVRGSIEVKWLDHPSVHLRGFDEGEPPKPRLVGTNWLVQELKRGAREIKVERVTLPVFGTSPTVKLPKRLAKCAAPAQCGTAVPFGGSGWQLVYAGEDDGEDCQHYRCLLRDPATGRFGRPPLPATWSPTANTAVIGSCGPYRFDLSGKWYGTGNQLCATGGTCRTLGDALMLGWLDGGQDVGT